MARSNALTTLYKYEKEHGISKDDKIFRAVLYANDFESHEKAYKDLADSSSKTQKYNNFLKITRNYLITASAWLDASEKISW